MPEQKVHIEETFAADPAVIFAQFADHENFGKLLGAPVKRIQVSPHDDPNGIDSVRRVGLPGLALEETVIGFEPPRLIEYTVTRGGGPIRNHMGRIAFEPANGGTRVTYTVEFDARLPGTGGAVAFVLDKALRRAMARVETAA